MCGLYGVAGAISVNERRAFKDLAVISSIRGPHSTGLAAVSVTNKNMVLKRVGGPHEFLDSVVCNAMLGGQNKVLLGHGRFATVGDISLNNAHPFRFEGLVGAHNGTLHNIHKLENYLDFEVDSEVLFYNIDVNGLQETILKTGGAFALSWWDIEENTLRFLRNIQRPLYFCKSKDKETLFWASEKHMLSCALARNHISFSKILMFKPLQAYTFHLPARAFGIIETPKTQAIKQYTPPPLACAPAIKKGNVLFSAKSGYTSRTRDSSPCVYVKVYKDVSVHESRFKYLTKDGCLQCNEVPKITDDLLWIASDIFMCDFCAENTETKQWLIDEGYIDMTEN